MNHAPRPKGPKVINHGLHLMLTVFSCGVWGVTGWPIAWLCAPRMPAPYPPPPPTYPYR